MDISQRGIDLIKDYESYSSEAYLCPEGVPTIGWGSIRWDARTPVKLGDKCTVDQAEKLLRKEVMIIDNAIDQYVKVPLSQGEHDCLCAWGYNVGVGWINGKRKGGAATLIKYLNNGEKEKVPSELLKFKRGAISGKAYKGLVNRRKREIAELWLSDASQAPALVAAKPADVPPVPMPQSVEPDRPTPTQAVNNSVSAKSAVGGFLASAYLVILNGYEWLFGVAKEAGPQIIALKTNFAPFDPLLKLTPTLIAVFISATLVVVIVRKIATR